MICEISPKEPIHVVKASFMTKSELIAIIFDRKYWGAIEPEIPLMYNRDFGGTLHGPAHVFDKRKKRCLNLIEEGIKKGIIYKTQT